MVSITPTILRFIFIFFTDNQIDNGLSPHLIHYPFPASYLRHCKYINSYAIR